MLSKARPASRRTAASAGEDYGAGNRPDWRGVNWRAHLHDAQVLGRQVRYVDYGRGDDAPVVFIHGLSGRWQNWLENIPKVAEQRRVVALDLPGFGSSQMPEEKTSITLYARVVDALCEQLGLGEVALVGNSMGGFTAAEIALRHPARVERMVLVSAAGISIAELWPVPVRLALSLIGGRTPASGPHRRAVIARPLARHIAFGGIVRHPSRIAPDLLYEQICGMGTKGLLPALDALTSYDLRGDLRAIDCPTLIVHGSDDMLVPIADASEFERSIAGSRTLILDDTGHMPMIERPQSFNAELLAFLHSGRASSRADGGREPSRADAAQAARASVGRNLLESGQVDW